MNTLILLLFRIGAFFSFFSQKKSRNNQIKNLQYSSLIPDSDYIENQSLLKDIRIGNSNASFCGCGVIAIFNTLFFLGKINSKEHFFNIIPAFEKNGLVLAGRFGISPKNIYSYLNGQNLNISGIKASDTEKFDAFSSEYDCFISIIYNNVKSLKDGFHYISITKDGFGNFISHNPNKTDNSLFNVISKASNNKGKPLYTIGIKKKEI